MHLAGQSVATLWAPLVAAGGLFARASALCAGRTGRAARLQRETLQRVSMGGRPGRGAVRVCVVPAAGAPVVRTLPRGGGRAEAEMEIEMEMEMGMGMGMGMMWAEMAIPSAPPAQTQPGSRGRARCADRTAVSTARAGGGCARRSGQQSLQVDGQSGWGLGKTGRRGGAVERAL